MTRDTTVLNDTAFAPPTRSEPPHILTDTRRPAHLQPFRHRRRPFSFYLRHPQPRGQAEGVMCALLTNGRRQRLRQAEGDMCELLTAISPHYPCRSLSPHFVDSSHMTPFADPAGKRPPAHLPPPPTSRAPTECASPTCSPRCGLRAEILSGIGSGSSFPFFTCLFP